MSQWRRKSIDAAKAEVKSELQDIEAEMKMKFLVGKISDDASDQKALMYKICIPHQRIDSP